MTQIRIVLTLLCFASACMNGGGSSRCVPGAQVACSCENGLQGAQRCTAEKSFASCICEDDDVGFGPSEGDASTDDPWGDDPWDEDPWGNDAGVERDGGRGNLPDSGKTIATGDATLIDVYATADAVWVVDATQVRKLNSAGDILGTWKAPRPLTAAAFDGEHLVVADGAKLTTLVASSLSELVSANLLEACVSAVIVSGGRFVCGPANDWDRIFYTYDLTSGKLLASSAKYTYNGIPMRKVPGRDAFIAVTTGSSPSDYHLYKVDSVSHEVVYLQESPYHGDFAVTNTYSFDADLAQNLITQTGLLLAIDETSCATTMGTCLTKQGALGTLTGAQSFVGMDQVAGTLVGLVSVGSGSSFGDPACGQGCLLQTVDVLSRAVTSQQVVRLNVGSVTQMRALPDLSLAIVGARLPGDDWFDSPYPGYRVFALPLSE